MIPLGRILTSRRSPPSSRCRGRDLVPISALLRRLKKLIERSKMHEKKVPDWL
jgi:hypothetical protein